MQFKKGEMLDAQLIVQRLKKIGKTKFRHVFNELLPSEEEFREHDAFEDALLFANIFQLW